MNKSILVLDIKVSTVPQADIECQITDSLSGAGEPLRRLIFTPNPEMLSKSFSDLEFKKTLNQSWLNIPDGWGVVWASGGKIKKRITGVDLMEKLTMLAGQNGWRVFLLGSAPGVAERAAEILKSKIVSPHLNFKMMTLSGPPNITKARNDEINRIIDSVNRFKPNFLFVGFGHSKQEFFLSKYKDALWFDYAIGVGGAFDMISGLIKRAPIWIQKSGFEWLWRLLLEPKRWRRQILIFKFPVLVLRSLWNKSS